MCCLLRLPVSQTNSALGPKSEWRSPSSIVIALQLTHRSCSSENQHTMAAPASQYKDRQFIAVIGDEVRRLRLPDVHS